MNWIEQEARQFLSHEMQDLYNDPRFWFACRTGADSKVKQGVDVQVISKHMSCERLFRSSLLRLLCVTSCVFV